MKAYDITLAEQITHVTDMPWSARRSLQKPHHRSVIFCALAVGFLAACTHGTASAKGKRNFSANAKVVRGLNTNMCIGNNVKNGARPAPQRATDIMDNLSVNCDEGKDTEFKNLFQPGSPRQWTTTLGELRKGNRNVLLVEDPTPGNAHHCLISNITANEFCQRGTVR